LADPHLHVCAAINTGGRLGLDKRGSSATERIEYGRSIGGTPDSLATLLGILFMNPAGRVRSERIVADFSESGKTPLAMEANETERIQGDWSRVKVI